MTVSATAARPAASSASLPIDHKLRRGDRGGDVKALQLALIRTGYMTRDQYQTGPGIFGPRTQRAVAAFKREHGLHDNGVFGRYAKAALEKVLTALTGREPAAPAQQSGSHGGARGPVQNVPGPTGAVAVRDEPRVGGLTWSEAAERIRKAGGRVCPNGRPTVLAVRTGSGATPHYQDRFYVLRPNGKMTVHQATTRPTSAGSYGHAMLKPGEYSIAPRPADSKWDDAFYVMRTNGSMNVPVARDANGDGRYSQAERNAGYTSPYIRIHPAGQYTTSSMGCLNVRDYDAFLRAVGGHSAHYNLVLVGG